MSDLAPFVAAATRDRTVVELMKEIEKKDQMIDEILKVEITGPNGTPVYADGQFNKGNYGPEAHQWRPSLKHRQDCPLSELSGVEVRLGGVIQFSLDPDREEQVTWIQLQFNGEDHHSEYFEHGGKDMLIQMYDGSELYVVVRGWEEREWRPLLRPGVWDGTGPSALKYLINMPPGSRSRLVQFDGLSFHATKYESMIRRHVQLSQEAIRKRNEQLARKALTDAVVERADDAGLDSLQIGTVWMLVSSIFNIKAIDEEFERVIDPLINIHLLRQNDHEDPSVLYGELASIADLFGTRDQEVNRSQALTNFVEQVRGMIRQHLDGNIENL